MALVAFRLTKEMKRLMDLVILKSEYTNRSDFIRQAIKTKIDEDMEILAGRKRVLKQSRAEAIKVKEVAV